MLPEPTGADKTTVVLFQRDDHAGGLLALLEQFAARGINMTRLESRPTKESMGSYCFSIDLEGHVLDERVGEALMGLRRICAEVRFLGSYPRADRQRASIAPLTSDADFTAARSWLEGIRSGRADRLRTPGRSASLALEAEPPLLALAPVQRTGRARTARGAGRAPSISVTQRSCSIRAGSHAIRVDISGPATSTLSSTDTGPLTVLQPVSANTRPSPKTSRTSPCTGRGGGAVVDHGPRPGEHAHTLHRDRAVRRVVAATTAGERRGEGAHGDQGHDPTDRQERAGVPHRIVTSSGPGSCPGR